MALYGLIVHFVAISDRGIIWEDRGLVYVRTIVAEFFIIDAIPDLHMQLLLDGIAFASLALAFGAKK